MTEEKAVEGLKCTKVVRRDGGVDFAGNRLYYHEKCGLPASEVEIGGMLTKAKAILCKSHKAMADKQSFVSENGYSKGKVEYRGYNQNRMAGTGVLD